MNATCFYLFLICLISCSEKQLASSYITPVSRRLNQRSGGSQLQSQIQSNTESDFQFTSMSEFFDTVGRRILPSLLLSTLIFGICDMTLAAPAEAAFSTKTEESKIVSAYVPGLPTETASAPEFKANANAPSAVATADVPAAIEITTTEVKEAALVVKPIVPKLTAKELLQASVEPKIQLLKDILFTFKLYPGYLDSKDYVSFRAGLRQQPAMDLRKTCKLLKPFLPSDKQESFQESYLVMIDAVNDMDVLALKRVQGTGLPEKGAKDDVMVGLLDSAITRLDNLVALISTITF